jgi:hypothetical protein
MSAFLTQKTRANAYSGLGVHVAHIYAPLVVEQNLVALAARADGEVIFIGGLMGHERFDQKIFKYTLHALNIDLRHTNDSHS